MSPASALPFRNTNTDFANFITLVCNAGRVGGVLCGDGKINPNGRIKYFGFYNCTWNELASRGGFIGIPQETIIEDYKCDGYADYYTPMKAERCATQARYYYTASKKWVEDFIIGPRWEACRPIN